MRKFISFVLLSVLIVVSCDIQPIPVSNCKISGTVNINDSSSPIGTIISLETSVGFPVKSIEIVNLSGNFIMTGISPGDYKIFAGLDMDNDGIDDYSGYYGNNNPEVITLFSGDSLSVQITIYKNSRRDRHEIIPCGNK
ncbi:hypothetical protein DRP43_03445 [candidate division TA06 bacterium]|uniref:Carboxypeptidase regulatory-like domain-containing protein n=1 Tax=candidate division TA06 bacterium TaxID=2250710 RepID=A0A660SHZ8_UNCT6|nr:MAG: hypothetical protein DRP43_03445 [candidate division TA06 bacterium]